MDRAVAGARTVRIAPKPSTPHHSSHVGRIGNQRRMTPNPAVAPRKMGFSSRGRPVTHTGGNSEQIRRAPEVARVPAFTREGICTNEDEESPQSRKPQLKATHGSNQHGSAQDRSALLHRAVTHLTRRVDNYSGHGSPGQSS